jgi:hypothetical protein
MTDKTITEYIKEALLLDTAVELAKERLTECIDSAAEATNTDKKIFKDMVANAKLKAKDPEKYNSKVSNFEEVVAVVDSFEV